MFLNTTKASPTTLGDYPPPSPPPLPLPTPILIPLISTVNDFRIRIDSPIKPNTQVNIVVVKTSCMLAFICFPVYDVLVRCFLKYYVQGWVPCIAGDVSKLRMV